MAGQGFQQVQKQTQSLVLAPQLRHSLKILQVPTLELRHTILEELETNPVLEELPMEGVSLEEQAEDTEDSAPETEGEMEFGEGYEMLNRMDEDMREYYAQESNGTSYSSEDAERRQHFFESLTYETSLQEHLMRQAELNDVEPAVLKALEYIIGSLDDRGFLTGKISDLALLAQLPLRTMQEAHALLKSLDPPGIGSADLNECLLAQLSQNGRGNSLAARIIKNHIDLLLRHRIPELARKTKTRQEDVQDAIGEIATLDPAPGRKFTEDNNRVVVADVTVEQDETGEWLVHLNNDYIPRLRLSKAYKELLAQGKVSGKEKDYIQEKLRSGKFLISSIEQRQQTIERLTRKLLVFQREFFEEGLEKLRPLTMAQVAEEVGVHETTISRAIANKYINTPWGLFEFKYFFTTGYKTGINGESLSNTTVKERISRLIESEDAAKPRSDQEIVKRLAEEEITIARRTVAKYREELGIPPTHLRRRYA